jgi:hypothetical protein
MAIKSNSSYFCESSVKRFGTGYTLNDATLQKPTATYGFRSVTAKETIKIKRWFIFLAGFL